jgi:hypothetical protein
MGETKMGVEEDDGSKFISFFEGIGEGCMAGLD